MSQRTKGKCKYCGKEYTMSYMNKHLGTCKERQKRLEEETGKKKCGYFQLAICSKYSRNYWLFIEMRETASLRDLDSFLRDIWLECCGHLSAFDINGVTYDVESSEDDFWGEPAKSMDCKLKSVLEKGMTIGYRYDFGSTTSLTITVADYRIGWWKKEKLTILSRNNPPVFQCDRCGEKEAVTMCAGSWGEPYFLCEDCEETFDSDDYFLFDVCNSPRMGVCGYNGSDIYPDQFVPDTEE